MKPRSGDIEVAGMVRCWACSGKYGLGETKRGGHPAALHSLPYCAEYLAIDTVAEAIAFSAEKCRAKEQAN